MKRGATTMNKRAMAKLTCTPLVVMLAIWLVELSSVNATHLEDVNVTGACKLNVTDLKGVQKLFKEYTTEHKVQLVDFRISGIDWSDSSNETNEIFDPNLWSWTQKKSQALTLLPIDFSILSFGLSQLAMVELEVSVISFPTGCVNELPFEHQRRLVMNAVLHLTKNNDDEQEDLICQNDYSRRIAGRDIGVGRTCCNRGSFRGGLIHADCERDEQNLRSIDRFAQRFQAMSVFGFLLPFFIIPCAMIWWQYNPLAFSKIFTEYLSNKLYKMSIFKLETRQQEIIGASQAKGRLSGRRLIIGDDELESYDTPVSILNLLNVDMRGVSSGKIKLTLLLIFQYVLVVFWLSQYSKMSRTLRLLDSAEKIVFNLHNNLYSWLWTDRRFCPFYIALLLVFLNFLLVVLVILWWLMEIETVRLRFANLLKLEAKDESSLRKSKKTVRKVFKIFFVSLLVFSYISVYSLFNCIIYAAGALIASNEIVSPWATCAILVIYYTHRSCTDLTDTYSDIKRVVFKVCEQYKTYKATQDERVEVVKMTADTLDLKDKTLRYKSEEFEGPVWFVIEPQSNAVSHESIGVQDESRALLQSEDLPGAVVGQRTDTGSHEDMKHQSNAVSHESIGVQDEGGALLQSEDIPEAVGQRTDTGSHDDQQSNAVSHESIGDQDEGRALLQSEDVQEAVGQRPDNASHEDHQSNASPKNIGDQEEGRALLQSENRPEAIGHGPNTTTENRNQTAREVKGSSSDIPAMPDPNRLGFGSQSNVSEPADIDFGSQSNVSEPPGTDFGSQSNVSEPPDIDFGSQSNVSEPPGIAFGSGLTGNDQESKQSNTGCQGMHDGIRHRSSSLTSSVLERVLGPEYPPGYPESFRQQSAPDNQAGIRHRTNADGQQCIRQRSNAGHPEDVTLSRHNPEKPEGGLLKIRMSKATLRGIYDLIEPIKTGLKMTAVKLVFILLFVILVGITTAAFRPDAMTGSAGLIATLATLGVAMIPRILELMAKSTAAQSRLSGDVLEHNVKKLLYANRPTFRVLEEESSRQQPLSTLFSQGTEQNNAQNMETDTFSGKFPQIVSEQPVPIAIGFVPVNPPPLRRVINGYASALPPPSNPFSEDTERYDPDEARRSALRSTYYKGVANQKKTGHPVPIAKLNLPPKPQSFRVINERVSPHNQRAPFLQGTEQNKEKKSLCDIELDRFSGEHTQGVAKRPVVAGLEPERFDEDDWNMI